MYKIKVNNKSEHTIVLTDSSSKGTIDGNNFEWDVVKIKKGNFHAIKDNKSYNIEVERMKYAEKSLVISVNGNNYSLTVKDKYDELLHTLGMDDFTTIKVKEMKAPMPGLVLDIRVSEGMEIKKGDTLVVLEAMKMENILKSPVDGTVQKIHIRKGIAVEKNQVLINFS